MNQREKEEMYKRDGFEDEYYKVLVANLKKSENRDRWLVQNYNSASRDFSERFSWLAGIGIGLLPLIFQYLTPINCFQKGLIIFVLFFLLLSIVLGGVDFLISLDFWRQSVYKNKQAMRIWYSGMKEIIRNYPKTPEITYDKAIKKFERLDLNSEEDASKKLLIMQVLCVFLALTLQVFYLAIKLL